MKHFDGHCAFVKLLAWFIPEIKHIVAASRGAGKGIVLAVLAFGLVKGWW